MLLLVCSMPIMAQHKMTKLSNFDPNNIRFTYSNSRPWGYANIWGDEIDGREYAFLGACTFSPGTPNGVFIIDVTDPININPVAFITCPHASQRDFVTYTHSVTGNSYLYIIGEDGSFGMTIVDITNLPTSATVVNPSYFTGSYNTTDGSHAHNIQLDEVTGKMVVCGTHTTSPVEIFMFDVLANPAAPVLIDVLPTGSSSTYYAHDVYFNNDRLYSASVNDMPPYVGSFPIFNTSIPGNRFDYIGGLDPYRSDQSPSISITALNHVIHDIYASADHKKLVTSDEHVLGQAIFWDISDPANPIETDRYGGHFSSMVDTVCQHNHVIQGNDRCFASHYSNGLWVLDISDPYNVQEIAYYDTYLEHNYGNYKTYDHEFHTPYGTGYYGAWGVFADLPSGNILVCDMNTGLYVLNNCVNPGLQSGSNLTFGPASFSNQVFGKVATNTITVDPGTGAYTVGTDANVTLTAGTKITIKPGFHAQADGKFHAQIGSMCQNCPTCPPTAPPAPPHKPVVPSNNMALSDKLLCYPNPASTQLNLQISLAVAGVASVSVHDQFGRNVINVFEHILTDSGIMQKTIDIHALPSGIYTVKLKTTYGVQAVRFTKL
ncbi:MAG: hypothetical protein FD123_2512 [Bacteroidetes bacterium]|nr:MAG: hypothetical protein FD123_2512 [Bacteroidota bacterium]